MTVVAPNALVARMLAMPFTHEVVTVYAHGERYAFPVRSAAQAENHAHLVRRKLNRDLIDRETGNTVRVIAVEIREL